MTVKFLKASYGDCILISFLDPDKQLRNILVDGGIDATYYDNENGVSGELKNEIESIKSSNLKIDLLILTHIDNDHVCGLIQWLRQDPTAPKFISNVWFNSGRLISQYFKESDVKSGVEVKDITSQFTGVKEAIEFDDYLQASGIKIEGLILSGQSYTSFGVTLQILTPTLSQLQDVLGLFKGLLKEEKETPYTAGKSDWTIDFHELIKSEQKRTSFRQDSSITNGSSITFLMTVADKKFLFLADGHPKPIVEALKMIGFSEEAPLNVEFIKLSHHGSHLNTNNELLRVVKTNRYVISSDGTKYGHPHKKTIARILSLNPNAEIQFNYENVIPAIQTSKDKETGYKLTKAIYQEEL